MEHLTPTYGFNTTNTCYDGFSLPGASERLKPLSLLQAERIQHGGKILCHRLLVLHAVLSLNAKNTDVLTHYEDRLAEQSHIR